VIFGYIKRVKNLYRSAQDYHSRILTARREIDDVIRLSEDLFDKYGTLVEQLHAQSAQLASDTQQLVEEVSTDSQRVRVEVEQAQRAVQRLLSL